MVRAARSGFVQVLLAVEPVIDVRFADGTTVSVTVFERLQFERPRIDVEVMDRYFYVRRGDPDAGVFALPAPLGILPGVKYDFSVIAATLSMKLNFHQPTYRQQDILPRPVTSPAARR